MSGASDQSGNLNAATIFSILAFTFLTLAVLAAAFSGVSQNAITAFIAALVCSSMAIAAWHGSETARRTSLIFAWLLVFVPPVGTGFGITLLSSCESWQKWLVAGKPPARLPPNRGFNVISISDWVMLSALPLALLLSYILVGGLERWEVPEKHSVWFSCLGLLPLIPAFRRKPLRMLAAVFTTIVFVALAMFDILLAFIALTLVFSVVIIHTIFYPSEPNC